MLCHAIEAMIDGHFKSFALCFVYKSIAQVSLAKPPSDKKKKEEILRARERRMIQMMQGRTGAIGYVFVTSPQMKRAAESIDIDR